MRFGTFLFSLHCIELLFRPDLIAHQGFVSFIVLTRFPDTHPCGIDIRLCCGQVGFGGCYIRLCNQYPGFGILQCSLGLLNLYAQVTVVDEQERIALVYELIVLELHLIDIPGDTTDHGTDVTVYLGIVGVFVMTSIGELGISPCRDRHNYQGQDNRK